MVISRRINLNESSISKMNHKSDRFPQFSDDFHIRRHRLRKRSPIRIPQTITHTRNTHTVADDQDNNVTDRRIKVGLSGS